MKKLYLLLSVLFLIYWSCEDTKEEEPHYIFVKTFGSNGDDIGRSVQQTADGGYIITGEAGCGVNGGGIWLLKTNFQGQVEWKQNFGGIDYGLFDDSEGRSVQQTDDGYIITGETYSFGNDQGSDLWLFKTDPKGNTVLYGEEWLIINLR